MGAYGLLTVDAGKITLTAGGATQDLPTTQTHFNGPDPGSVHISGPPGYLRRYGQYLPDSYFGDLTYSPDLPTVNDVISQAYPQIGGQPIDGTLAIDPAGLAALLRITGPVTVAGLPQPLTTSNANDVLLRQQYLDFQGSSESAPRHDFLQNALKGAFERLTTGSLPGPRTLSDDLDASVRAGDIQFWSSHPADQALLKEINIDGTFPSADGGDLLSVTTDNTSNDKLDSYLTKAVDDRVTYDPASGAVTDQVTVTLHNSAPSNGLPSYVIGGYPGSEAPAGTAIEWLTVYSPLQVARQPSAPSDIVPPGTRELGMNAYSAFVTVPSQKTTTVTMTLEGRLHASGDYRLTLRQQPRATNGLFTIEVTGPPGWAPTRHDRSLLGWVTAGAATRCQVRTNSVRVSHPYSVSTASLSTGGSSFTGGKRVPWHTLPFATPRYLLWRHRRVANVPRSAVHNI